jgi:mannose-6-phosphate isomerase-like protein (cupin superfamily)
MSSLSEISKTQNVRKAHGKNFSAAHAGKFANLGEYSFEHPLKKRPVSGKFFLKDHIELTGMQVSLSKLPAGAAIPFYHKHKQNEELYIFVGGKGQMQVDGEVIDVEEGTCVRIAPSGERTIRNTSDHDLFYICIQAKENSLSQDTFDDGLPVDRQVAW